MNLKRAIFSLSFIAATAFANEKNGSEEIPVYVRTCSGQAFMKTKNDVREMSFSALMIANTRSVFLEFFETLPNGKRGYNIGSGFYTHDDQLIVILDDKTKHSGKLKADGSFSLIENSNNKASDELMHMSGKFNCSEESQGKLII